MTKLLKPRLVAEALSITDREVRNLCVMGPAKGGLRAMKVGKHWRIHPDDLEAFIRAGRGLTAPVDAMKKAASS